MNRSKIHESKPGEWIQPVRRGYKLVCCDCDLVHRIDFRIHKGHVQFRVFRDEKSTGQRRRYNGGSILKNLTDLICKE